jgi:hypothetical protein
VPDRQISEENKKIEKKDPQIENRNRDTNETEGVMWEGRRRSVHEEA